MMSGWNRVQFGCFFCVCRSAGFSHRGVDVCVVCFAGHQKRACEESMRCGLSTNQDDEEESTSLSSSLCLSNGYEYVIVACEK